MVKKHSQKLLFEAIIRGKINLKRKTHPKLTNTPMLNRLKARIACQIYTCSIKAEDL